MELNPKVKDFLEKHKEMTLIDLAWSLFWRLYVTIILVAFIAGVIVGVLEN